jgi:hypothetical protein
MTVNGINYTNTHAGYVNFEGKNKKDIHYPKHPGIICPPEIEAQNRKRQIKVAATALGLITAGVLAFVFRGKLRNMYDAVKPTIQSAKDVVVDYGKKGIEKARDLFKKGVEFAESTINKVKNLITDTLKAVKNFFTKPKV